MEKCAGVVWVGKRCADRLHQRILDERTSHDGSHPVGAVVNFQHRCQKRHPLDHVWKGASKVTSSGSRHTSRDSDTEADIAHRRDEVVKRMLATPPQPKKQKAKT